MARPEAHLDMRCLLSASTNMPVVYEERVAPFHVLLDGECDLHVDGTVIHMRPGDVVIVPGGAHHSITTAGEGKVRRTVGTRGKAFTTTRSESGDDVIDLLCGHFTYEPGAGALLFQTLPDPLHVAFERTADADRTIHVLSEMMRDEAEREEQGTAAILSALCSVLLAMALRTSRANQGQTLWTAAGDESIAAAVEMIVADPGGDWSIERLSRRSRMSRATFLRRFVQSTGVTVGVFLTRTRMIAASDLLRTETRTVADIAAQVGYTSESAFGRAFRAATGTTPARFRRQARGL
jgi:AraC family transcriptional activator of mtrCDE